MDGESPRSKSTVLLLGHLQVERDGGRIPVVGRQQAVLLALLACRIGQVVPSEQLVEAAWDGRPPSTAAAALRVHLAKLRALLAGDAGPNPLRSIGQGYVLDERYVDTDVHAVARLVERARSGPDRKAADLLADALGRWRGEPLSGVRDVAWLQREVQRLRDLRLDLQDELTMLGLRQGRHVDLCTELSVLVKEEPLREVRTRQLMLALYRSGHQADALSVYGELRDALVEELGVDPAPETRRLELAILRQEPGLAAPVAEPDAVTLVEPGPRGALDRPRSTALVRDVVRQRLELLSDGELRAVRLVAVLGELADRDVVAAAAGLGPDSLVAVVDRAREVGLLADPEEGRPLRFARGALRDEVLVGLPDDDRAELHDCCAATLERALPGAGGCFAAAWHRVARARLRPSDAEEAGYGLLRALDACRSLHRHDLVELLAGRALEETGWPAAIEVDIITRTVFAQQALGHGREAAELWERGLELARRTGDAERMALLVLTHDWTNRSMLAQDVAGPLLAEVLALLGPHPSALRVEVASAYLVESVTPGRAEEVRDLLHEVHQQAEELADVASSRIVDYARHVLLRGAPDLEARREVAQRLWAALGVPDPPALWSAEALLASIFDACVAGDIDRAEDLVDDLGSSAEASGSVRLRWQHAITRAALSRERGDLAASDAIAEEAMLLGAEGGIPDALGADALHRLQVLFHSGTLDPLRRTIEDFVRAQPDNALVLSAHALATAQGESVPRARATIESAVRRLRSLRPDDEVTVLCAALVVEAASLVGALSEPDRVWLEDLLRPFSGQFVTFGQVSATWGPVDRLLGLLAVLGSAPRRGADLMSAAAASTRSKLWRDRVAADLIALTAR